MKYSDVVQGTFLRRPNRFIAHCMVQGQQVVAHVKNTGRCKELLVPGATVYLQHSNNPKRKTNYSLIAVQKGERLINMDAQAPNAVAAEAIEKGTIRLPLHPGEQITSLRREVTYGDSRFDMQVHTDRRTFFVEVKGVTLEEDGVVLFPDAPTQRGVKHLQGLMRAVEEGYSCCVLLVVQMENVRYFVPNNKTHPQFGELLVQAAHSGVTVLAYDCTVLPDSITARKPVKVCL